MAARYQSPDARELVRLDPKIPREELDYIELGYIAGARGRIEARHGDVTVNPGGKVDGARFYQLHEDGRVTIRVDTTAIPSFWLELDIDPARLATWIAQTKEREGMDQ